MKIRQQSYCNHYVQHNERKYHAWIVWQSLAWPRISSSAGSETKKNRGNTSRLLSRYLKKSSTSRLLAYLQHMKRYDYGYKMCSEYHLNHYNLNYCNLSMLLAKIPVSSWNTIYTIFQKRPRLYI